MGARPAVIRRSGPEPGKDPSSDIESRDRRGRPLHDLRISVIDRCNFRCGYCMPDDRFHAGYAFAAPDELLSFAEIERLARLHVLLGVRKLRITGGEPLLRRNLPALIGALAAIGGVEDLALTTNGVLLERHAASLRRAGLQRVTVSLDSLDEDVFARMNGGRREAARVLAGIRAAEAAGFAAIKINVVVQRGVNEHTAMDLLEHFRGTDCTVRLIELMDVGTRNAWHLEQVVPSAELVRRVHRRWPIAPVEAGYRGEVASRYRYRDGAGEIGFISSVTAPFCGDCTRARIAADGTLYTCLFASAGTPLRERLRGGASDTDLLDLLRGVWRGRDDRYSELRRR
ncbi:MAG TPA: GTP 3',8-cyclase MoaA, partial [Gammaproteobacteria bacterium]|nr:GTP 3',8-cyclase MoaA [Gammaproteobacteria bacterium]